MRTTRRRGQPGVALDAVERAAEDDLRESDEAVHRDAHRVDEHGFKRPSCSLASSIANMRPAGVALLAVVLLAGPAATPALGAARSIDVRISAHLRSDYRFTYDYVDTSDPDCPQTIRASSRVVTDMPTVRPARSEITRLPRNGGYAFLKRSGGPRPADRAIDMRAEMTRSTEGGSETPCFGYEPIRGALRHASGPSRPPEHGARSVPREPGGPGLPEHRAGDEDDEWRGAAAATTPRRPTSTALVSRDNQVRASRPTSHRSLSAALPPRAPHAGPARLVLVHPGQPNQFGGGFTEVRTVEVTIRKLR